MAHNLLGGRDPSLVDGLGSTALPTSVLLLGEEVTHNLLGGRDPSLVSGLAQYGPPNSNTVFWRLRLPRPSEVVVSCVGGSWAPGHSQCHALQGTAMAYSNAILDFGKAQCRILLTWPEPCCKWQMTVCAASHQTFGDHHSLELRDSCGKDLYGNISDAA